jgi:type II secretory pathway pseudopilin PulG
MFRTRSCREARRSVAQDPAPAPGDLQAGYTLAALLVVLTIISIIIAYTVPSQWSLIMRREREKQTIFLMKQFARGIDNWQRKHQGLPVSLDQLQKARQPRMLRGEGTWACPLTGRDTDWIMVPPNAIEAAPGGNLAAPPVQGGVGVGRGNQPVGPGQPGKLNPEASPKDYVGPFVAVRPNARGPSLIALNGAEDYSQWVYTVQDLKNEIAMRQMALSVPK